MVGRGLRRVSYDKDENGLFLPEYVNVFGVPLTISETGDSGEAPPPPKPSTQIEVTPERVILEIKWPNILRIETVVKSTLRVDFNKVEPLVLDPASTPISAELAPALGGATDLAKVAEIDLEKLPDGFRLQRIIFQAARKTFAELSHGFSGTPEYLAAQLVRLIESFLISDRVDIPSLFHSDPLRRRILIALNVDLVVQHLLHYINQENAESLTPVFDEENPVGATGQMRTWYTTKPCQLTNKSHISHVVGDAAWEGYAANVMEARDDVEAYAKNDHLNFQIYYMWNGSRRRYVPDFLIKLSEGKILVLEIKGQDSPQNKAKREALDEWVRAVSSYGGFGEWVWDVAFKPSDVHDIITRHGRSRTALVDAT